MQIMVDRFVSDENSTGSLISVDGEFLCFGLEDQYSVTKIDGGTRIPEGEYDVTLRTEGGLHARYAYKFGERHHGMLWIRDVPNFEWVMIHIGNDADDTEGCPLTGFQISCSPDIRVYHSTDAYLALYDKVWEAARDNRLTATFINNDGTPEYPLPFYAR
jgi:hypothetical protein